ncbi:MAG: hypothetical protein V2B18_25140, partial [Pseudomonadota bacterium]
MDLNGIAAELVRCRAAGEENCVDVTRTLYRYWPEIRHRDLSNGVLEMFRDLPESPYREWSLALLQSSETG